MKLLRTESSSYNASYGFGSRAPDLTRTLSSKYSGSVRRYDFAESFDVPVLALASDDDVADAEAVYLQPVSNGNLAAGSQALESYDICGSGTGSACRAVGDKAPNNMVNLLKQVSVCDFAKVTLCAGIFSFLR